MQSGEALEPGEEQSAEEPSSSGPLLEGSPSDRPAPVPYPSEQPIPYFAGEEGRKRAREAGLKSAETRRRQSAMSPEERALDAIRHRTPDLTRELLKAALGEGDFSDLKLDTRVAALKTLLEYGLGKPTSGSKTADSDDEPSGPTPESLFAAPRIDAAAVSDKTA